MIGDSDEDEPLPKKRKTSTTYSKSLSAVDDMKILLSPSDWLNDRLINAAQALLKQQFSIGGLQDVLRGQTWAFEVERSEFVQILHDGGAHWLTISNIGSGNLVKVYDSLYNSVGSGL